MPAAWFDADGAEIATAIPQGDYRECSLSPDGRYLALVVNDIRTGTGDSWVHDFNLGLRNRLTTSEWAEFRPEWSPEGCRIAFSTDPHGPPNLFIIDARRRDGPVPADVDRFGLHPDRRIMVMQDTEDQYVGRSQVIVGWQ